MAGGVLDAQVHIGRETVYGTHVVPTRSIEALEDIASAQREPIQSVGMRAGLQTVRTDRRRMIFKGAEGSIMLHPHELGFGMMLRAAIGTSAIAQQGTTAAWLQTFSTDAKAPNEYITAVIGRPPVDPATAPIPWTYAGGIVHEVSFEQEVGDGDSGQLKATFGMDFQNELLLADGGQPLPVPVYPNSQFVYGWPELQVTVDGGALGDTRSFSVTIPHEVNRERYYMRRSTLKKQPIRSGVPEITGSMEFDYVDGVLYDAVRSSDIIPVIAEWRHPNPNAIAPGRTFFLRITMNVQFTGNTPEVSLDDLPNQPIEFMCLHDGTNPAVKVEYQSTDVAF